VTATDKPLYEAGSAACKLPTSLPPKLAGEEEIWSPSARAAARDPELTVTSIFMSLVPVRRRGGIGGGGGGGGGGGVGKAAEVAFSPRRAAAARTVLGVPCSSGRSAISCSRRRSARLGATKSSPFAPSRIFRIETRLASMAIAAASAPSIVERPAAEPASAAAFATPLMVSDSVKAKFGEGEGVSDHTLGPV